MVDFNFNNDFFLNNFFFILILCWYFNVENTGNQQNNCRPDIYVEIFKRTWISGGKVFFSKAINYFLIVCLFNFRKFRKCNDAYKYSTSIRMMTLLICARIYYSAGPFDKLYLIAYYPLWPIVSIKGQGSIVSRIVFAIFLQHEILKEMQLNCDEVCFLKYCVYVVFLMCYMLVLWRGVRLNMVNIVLNNGEINYL